MGRNRMYSHSMLRAYRGGNSTTDPYWCDWGAVVGDRIRRLRRDRDMRLIDLAMVVRKPEGGHYNPGYYSRLERGWASAPLYVYLAVADALEVDAGVLLGPDAASLDVSEAEATLLRCLRSLGIAPHEAMTALVKRLDARDGDQQLEAVDHGGLGGGRTAPVIHE
jgi:transcriptional regulator with XRE-family HTH domain